VRIEVERTTGQARGRRHRFRSDWLDPGRKGDEPGSDSGQDDLDPGCVLGQRVVRELGGSCARRRDEVTGRSTKDDGRTQQGGGRDGDRETTDDRAGDKETERVLTGCAADRAAEP